MAHEGCPIEAMLDAGDAIIDSIDTLDSPVNRGKINLARIAFQEVEKRIDCEQSKVNQNGQFVCPLADTVANAQGYASAPVNEQAFILDLSELAGETQPSFSKRVSNTGQYL